MSAAAKKAPRQELVIQPQPGPQSQLAACTADIAFYGGAAGGGKSWALVTEAARWVKRTDFAAIFFRRTSKQIAGGGGIWEESMKIYPALKGRPIRTRLEWRFPSGATIQFSHLEHEQNKHDHQSKQYALICFDELTQFTEGQFWYLVSRNRSVCGVKPYIRAATNPDPDSFVRRLIAWWIGADGRPIPERSGVVRWFLRDPDTNELEWFDSEFDARRSAANDDREPLSFTFIAAELADNPILEQKDPRYRARLQSLPKVERERLLGANWNVRATAGQYFQRAFFEVVDAPPAPVEILKKVRAWDKAATEPNVNNPDPDWTVGVLYARTRDGTFWILNAVRDRRRPAGVEQMITNTASQDGKRVPVVLWQDPGQAGKMDVDHYVRLLSGHTVKVHRASHDKETYAGPVSSQAENGNIKVVRGPWNDWFFSELEAFPEGSHDDAVDTLSLAHLEVAEDAVDYLRRLSKIRSG